MAKAEQNQIGWTTLFKNFHFSISANSFCIFATRSIYTEAQRDFFDPKTLRHEHKAPIDLHD